MGKELITRVQHPSAGSHIDFWNRNLDYSSNLTGGRNRCWFVDRNFSSVKEVLGLMTKRLLSPPDSEIQQLLFRGLGGRPGGTADWRFAPGPTDNSHLAASSSAAEE